MITVMMSGLLAFSNFDVDILAGTCRPSDVRGFTNARVCGVISPRNNRVVWILIRNMLVWHGPVSRALPKPAPLEVNENFQVARAAFFPSFDSVVHVIYRVTETDPNIIVGDEIIDKIVQDPVSEGRKRTNANDSAVVLQTIDCPL
jgi:hypothetical protein